MKILRKLKRLIPYFVLTTWTGLLYLPAVSNPFAYDDQQQIVRNGALRSVTSTTAYFRQPVEFSEEFGLPSSSFYRPLFWLSLFVDRTVWSLDPAGFHLTNVGIHMVNAVLVFLLFRPLLGAHLGLASALAWAGLPIHSEVVAWVSARGISLAAMFVLAAVLGAVRYVETERVGFGVLVTVGAAAALLSHEAGITAVPLVWLAAASASHRHYLSRHSLVAAGWAGVPFGLYVLLRTVGFRSPTASLGAFTDVLLWAPVSLAKYVWWTIHAPAMSVERSTELTGLGFLSWIYLLAWVMIGSLAILTVRYHRVGPAAAFGTVWTFIALLPFLHFLPLYQSMAERYVYLASIGTVLAVAGACAALQRHLSWPVWTPIVGMGLWIVLSLAPLQTRLHAWSDERLLYETSLRASPESPILNYNLGVEHEERGNIRAAVSYYETAIELKPDYIAPRLALANAHLRNNELGRALDAYTTLLQYAPHHYEAQLNRAAILLVQGDVASGVAALEELVRREPLRYEGRINLGAALLERNPEEARIHLEAARRIRPTSSEAAYNLGVLEREAGRIDRARALFVEALGYQPENQQAADALRALE